MSITISDEIVEAARMTQLELLQEMAMHLFQSGKLTLGYAAQMAKMNRPSFEALLKARQIPLYVYDVEDFEADVQTLQALSRL